MISSENRMVVRESTVFEKGVYFLPGGISVEADNVTIEGNGATLIGLDRKGTGIEMEGRKNITIRNLNLRDYYHGINAHACKHLMITGCTITSTAEVVANTIFLNIWLPPRKAYGAAILLWQVEDSQVIYNNLQHQMNGLLTYRCRNLSVRRNNASYNSGFGFHLYETVDSLYEGNHADYCCRYQPRTEGPGHMGADSTGFLLVAGASRNVFRGNFARMSGDGFYLSGLDPRYRFMPCDNNVFERNDASYSPNIGFEATFSKGNTFRGNNANYCTYGFWLGFSNEYVLEENRMYYNREAGLAVENGFEFKVQGNTFHHNRHGMLLWSKRVPEFESVVPQNNTLYNWEIEDNTFTSNFRGIRIVPNQDQGVRPYLPPEGETPTPHRLNIRNNTFRDNRVGIMIVGVGQSELRGNDFKDSIEDDVRRSYDELML